jgi:hypothetical protein
LHHKSDILAGGRPVSQSYNRNRHLPGVRCDMPVHAREIGCFYPAVNEGFVVSSGLFQ